MSDVIETNVGTQFVTPSASTMPNHYDVVIVGGGMAGLTLALQLKQMRPTIKVVVVEKQKHPVPEAAHKVGESTVEIAAHYLRDILGLEEHLQTQELRKFGLRMFFSANGNHDITRRVEYGQAQAAPLPTYQLDRGRLENALGCEIQQRGIDFLDDCKVQQVSLQHEQDFHSLHLLHEGNPLTIQARWVVDASGRQALLKRQLGLSKKVAHNANAVWFRVGKTIDINEWSDDPEWQARISEGERSLSTNHLMGPGYWVWLIRLASGSTSIGIVTDAATHPFEGMNRFERALDWLHEHEPQCAAAIERHLHDVQDFRVMKDYAYSAQQVYSGERWCLTGEAGISIDPLYSSGGDLIAISNGLICDLIDRDLNGEDITERAAIHDKLFFIFADVWLDAYQQQYSLMGNVQVMVVKIVWDTAIYWAAPGLLYFHDKLSTVTESPFMVPYLIRFSLLNNRIQAFFREWNALDQPPLSDRYVEPYALLDFLFTLHNGMAAGLGDAELEVQFAANVRFIELLAGQIVSTVIDVYAEYTENETMRSQIQQWQAEPFLAELIALYQQNEEAHKIDSSWIALAHQQHYQQEVVL